MGLESGGLLSKTVWKEAVFHQTLKSNVITKTVLIKIGKILFTITD